MQIQGKSLFIPFLLAIFIAQYAVADDIREQNTAFAFGDWTAMRLGIGQIGLFSKQKSMVTKNVWTLYSPFGLFFWWLDDPDHLEFPLPYPHGY